MISRPDILSWMRTIYWKHNKPRRLRQRQGTLDVALLFERNGPSIDGFYGEQRDQGDWRPYQVSMASASEGIPAVGTASSARGRVETITAADRPTSSGESGNTSNWKDVMLR